jgi:signal transduction histidine kinase/ligand-binding sensor domain-containing protein
MELGSMQNQRVPKLERQIVLVAAALLVLFAAPIAQALEPRTRLTQYAHHSWRIGDAGLLGTPQSIAQTSDGYIWVSTENGLYRFDGLRFTKWEPPAGESLPSSMWYLFGARSGALYVGTDRGLVRIRDGHVYTYPGSPRWPGPFVEDSAGSLWMGVSSARTEPSALCRVGEESLTCFGAKDGFACLRGRSVATDADGYFRIGCAEGICRWKPGATPETAPIPALSRRNGLSWVTSLAKGSDGTMWAGLNFKEQGAGLLRLANGKWSSYVAPGIDGSSLSVSFLLAERNGPLWIGTSDQGLYKLVNGRLDHFDTIDGLSDHNILSIFEDREGGVWVATPKGIDHFRDYAVLSFTSSEGFLAGHASSVAADRKGSVFLGSNTLVRLAGQKLNTMRDSHGQPLQDAEFLFTDSEDNLWIGAGDSLLVMRDRHAISAVDGPPVLEGAYTVYITEDREHDIWASVENLESRVSKLVQIRNNQVIAKFDESPAIGKQVMNALAPNPAGGLWVGGAEHGLFWFHDRRFERVSAGGFDDRVENLMTERGGALWIVTQRGFVRYFDGRAQRLTSASGLPCDSGVNIQNDERGFTWFYMHCGIVRVSDADLAAWWQSSNQRIHGRVFNALEGARPNLSNGSPAQAVDGTLWSASDYEFQSIDTQHLPFNKIPPPVMLERFAADGHDFTPDRNLRMPMHTSQIEIDYAGLSFLIPELVRFRYRLEGHDANWVDAGNRRQAFYNDLVPGRYVFHVIACNNDGVWNRQGAEITFTIPPAWYQTLFFRIAAVLLLIAIVTLAYIYRMKRYVRSLKERFDERLQERTRLARDLHDTLLQTIQGSKMVADEAREHVQDARLTGRALDRLSDWLERASVEGRAALEALRSSPIEANDLVGALHRAADDCLPGTKMNVNISTVGLVIELHPIARDEVYRIAYEAIRNACAHSGARDLWIELEYNRRFHMTIRDNGRGVSEEILRGGRAGHFGLAGMRERALFIGGDFNISSSPENGTTVSVVIPGQAIYRNPSHGVRSWLLNLLRSRRDRSDV